MTPIAKLRTLALLFPMSLAATARGEAPTWIEFPGGAGPGAGKRVALLSGDEEYRSEEGLPMLARILSERHGFHCTVLFAVDAKSGEINPNNVKSLPGSQALESADAIVMLLRFRAWPDEAMARFVKAFEAGKPIIALRTSTHAFRFPDGNPYRAFNDFGKNVLGEQWISHWGRHKFEATRGVIEPDAAGNPIMRGVTDVYGDTDVYEAYPPSDATILLRGQVLAGMAPDSGPATHRKKRTSDGAEQGVNDPMMPIAWTRERKNDGGSTNRIFCTTLGAATDMRSKGLRRLLVNAVYWGLTLDVPDAADVEVVGEYHPSAYGFDGFRRGLRPVDFAPATAEPAGVTQGRVPPDF